MQMKMTLSPKKFVSHFTSSTNNKGVEAKETEIPNTQLDGMSASNSTGAHYQVDSSSGSLLEQLQRGLEVESASPITSLPATDEASYIQVIVQKHHKKRETQVPGQHQGSPRLPKSSSPINKPEAYNRKIRGPSGDAEPRELYVLPHPMLLSYCPPRADRQRYYSWARRTLGPLGARPSRSLGRLVGARRARSLPRHGPAPPPPPVQIQKESFWKRMTKISEDDLDPLEDGVGPERVEVYYFEREDSSLLRTTDGAPAAAGERWARRGERAAARACQELIALPACLLQLPITLLLLMLRAACMAVRGATLGAVTVLADYLLKPTLAVAFNALLRPPLVLLHNTARALRDALEPIVGLIGDLLAPLERLLGAVRLVHVSPPSSAV